MYLNIQKLDRFMTMPNHIFLYVLKEDRELSWADVWYLCAVSHGIWHLTQFANLSEIWPANTTASRWKSKHSSPRAGIDIQLPNIIFLQQRENKENLPLSSPSIHLNTYSDVNITYPKEEVKCEDVQVANSLKTRKVMFSQKDMVIIIIIGEKRKKDLLVHQVF